MFIYYNPNPGHWNTGDCVIRGISKLMNQSWEWTYLMVCLQGFLIHKMPSYNEVWGEYLYNCEIITIRNTSDQAILMKNAEIRIYRP